MDEQTRRRIKEHLQLENVQDRVLRAMEKGRAEATVTISRAAELFRLTENRLRDWEEYGLLSPLRPTGPKGRRLYTPGELDKLAIIRELLEAGYAPSDIPPDVDAIWQTVYVPGREPSSTEATLPCFHNKVTSIDCLSVNQRIHQARDDLFWRFYVSHVLRFTLLLICENLSHIAACLVLPLEPIVPPSAIQRVEDLERLGECLVGLLSQSRSSHTLLTAAPTFDYASDYRFQPLAAMMEEPAAEEWQNSTFLLLDRRARQVTLSATVIDCVGRLLGPLYEDVERSRVCFGVGMRDVLNPSTDLDSVANHEDLILNGMAEMVIRLGGQTATGEPRWHFCCLLLPNYPASVLSLQQRGLVVRARSSHSPYKIGVTTVSPHDIPVDPCIRALQSGHIVYLHSLAEDTSSINLRHASQPTRSAIAVPIAGSDGMAFAVMYVAAPTAHVFSESDQRILRLLGDMVGELLETYQTLLRPISRLRDLISNPGVVDPLFRDFLSENEFAVDVEKLLAKASQQGEEGVVSLIAVDIDNQSSLAHKYGDFMARELSRAIGLRIKGQLQALKEDASCRFYRMNADRYYLVLDGMSLEQARARADLLRKMLSGSYHVDTQRILHGPPTLPENMMTLHNVTVRLGVSSYLYSKLQEIIQRFYTENALVEARLLLARFLDEVLDIGKREGGNIVVSWDPEMRGFVRIPPSFL